MATNTLRRYIWLLETLERLEYATFREIQEAWKHAPINTDNEDLPRRTFRNHITAISEQMKLYIEYKPGHGYYIANPQDLKESHIKQWMLSTLSVYNLLAECKDLKDHILIEEIPSCEAFLTPIAQAIRRGHVLTFVYRSNQNPAPHKVEVEPYCLKLFKRRWYLVGRNVAKDEIRIYALERMREVAETQRAYTIPAHFNAEDYFAPYYGITVDGAPELIRLKVIPREARYMRSLPLHPSQEEVETCEEYSIFTLYLSPTWDFKQELLSRADQLEVLAPASLREWMRGMIRRMMGRYEEG